MPASDPLDILLRHNLWATRQILEACAKLTSEQFHQRFEIGPGSLHDTTAHILGALHRWSDVLAEREPRGRMEDDRRTAEELLELLGEISVEIEGLAGAHAVDALVTPTRGGRSYTFTRGGVLTHVLTHGMHHRAQCLNMLRRLGVDPLPPSSVVEWMLAVDAAS